MASEKTGAVAALSLVTPANTELERHSSARQRADGWEQYVLERLRYLVSTATVTSENATRSQK